MAEKISPDTLLPVALELFLSTPKASIDRICTDTLEERREQHLEAFVIFYSQLRDRLTEVE